MSYIEKEKLIKADIASIENKVRHAFNQGYDLGYKEGKSNECCKHFEDIKKDIDSWALREEPSSSEFPNKSENPTCSDCVRRKMAWLERDYDTYPSDDGKWEVEDEND